MCSFLMKDSFHKQNISVLPRQRNPSTQAHRKRANNLSKTKRVRVFGSIMAIKGKKLYDQSHLKKYYMLIAGEDYKRQLEDQTNKGRYQINTRD